MKTRGIPVLDEDQTMMMKEQDRAESEGETGYVKEGGEESYGVNGGKIRGPGRKRSKLSDRKWAAGGSERCSTSSCSDEFDGCF